MKIYNFEMFEPYWHTNKEWYYYDETDEIFKLTDKATEKAKQSYDEYHNKKISED